MKLFRVIFVLLLCIGGCQPDNYDQIKGPFVLEMQVYHHTVPVPHVQAFLATDVELFPGNNTSKYDLTQTADENGHIVFRHLFPGDHYIFARGFDGVDSVFGNAPVYLDSRDTDQHVKIIFQVSE